MNWQNIAFDWNQVRAFLVTAETGSLTAAAQALNLTQPTVGRQVAALEATLGVTLFERVGRSLVLSETGTRLLDHVRPMGEAAAKVALSASGQAQAIEGKVTITATDLFSAYLLPPVVARLRRLAPGITLDIVAVNDIRDLQRREADIALRHARPEQPDLVTRRLKDKPAQFFAATSYLDRVGRPQSRDDLRRLDWVGFGRPERMIAALHDYGLELDVENFRINCENSIVVWELVRQGLGVTVMALDMVERTSEVEAVLPELPPIPVPLWLTTHRELHTSRRIRLVFDLLAETFS